MATKLTTLSSEEIPWSIPNFLLSAAISWECGLGSQLRLPSFSSCFRLSTMHALDAGRKTTQFARPVTNAVVSGTSVPHRLAGSKKPESPPAGPKGLPGNVRARTAGKAVCRPKYQGKVLVWRSENCRTGRVLNWMMVPTHV